MYIKPVNVSIFLLRTSIKYFYSHRPPFGSAKRQVENSWRIFATVHRKLTNERKVSDSIATSHYLTQHCFTSLKGALASVCVQKENDRRSASTRIVEHTSGLRSIKQNYCKFSVQL